LELSPNNLVLYYKIAHALNKTGSFDEAISFLEKAIEIDPQQPYTYYTLGNILYNAKYLEDAITWHKKVCLASLILSSLFHFCLIAFDFCFEFARRFKSIMKINKHFNNLLL
jgi:tetratricopeptide (TPR) repeat protein